jgi:hypothetical protein
VQHSQFLAALLGIILVVGPVIKFVRHRLFVEACERAYRSPIAMLVIGSLLFIVSCAFVLSHSVWVADWRLIVILIAG